VLCGATGYAYDFKIYTGKSDDTLFDDDEDCSASGNVVIRIATSIPHHVNHKLSYDNYLMDQIFRFTWQRTASIQWAQAQSSKIDYHHVL